MGVSVRNADWDQDRTGSPLTASEQLLWAGQRLDPGAPLYNMALSIEIATALDVPAFRRAFRQLVDATDALRTSFIDVDGQPRRVVGRRVPATVELLQKGQRLTTGEETGYGLGWKLDTMTLTSQPARMAGYGTKQDFIGGTTYLMTFPEHRLVVAVMTNTSFADTKSIALQIAEAFAVKDDLRAK